MRALRNLAAIALAAGVALTIGATVTPAANAATLKPMTVQDARDLGWFVYIGTIEGPCTTIYLTTDKKNILLKRNDVPADQCGATDYLSSGLAPNALMVGRITNYKDNAPAYSGVRLERGVYTTKQWKAIVVKMVKPSAKSLTEIMAMSKPYLKR
jgi:hypothetical protein